MSGSAIGMQLVVTINTSPTCSAMRSLTTEGWQARPLLEGFGSGGALAAAMLPWSTVVARRVTSPS